MNYRGYNIFTRAAGEQREEYIEWLIQREDSDIDVHLNSGHTAIMDLIRYSKRKSGTLRGLLISKGVDTNARCLGSDVLPDGFAAIHIAVSELAISEVCEVYADILLNRGADPHIADSFGLTPTARAMNTSLSFSRWRRVLGENNQLDEAFCMEDVRRSTYLQAAGWNGHSLYELLICRFHAINDQKITRELSYWEIEGELWFWEPRWYDLQRYIRLRRRPIPPLWHQNTCKAGYASYIHELTASKLQESQVANSFRIYLTETPAKPTRRVKSRSRPSYHHYSKVNGHML